MYRNDITDEADQYTYEYFLRDDVCRLCWASNANHEIISKETFENTTEIPLLHRIKECLNIEVDINEPNKVCSNCIQEIDRFYSFKKRCYENDLRLCEILRTGTIDVKGEFKTENDDTNIDNIVTEDINCDDAINNDSTRKKIKINRIRKKKHEQKSLHTYCNICSFDLGSEESLLNHNNECHGIENGGTVFKCLGCEKRFKSKKTRMSHEVNFCKGLKDGYRCGICDRYLPRRCMYEYHMREHRHNRLIELPEEIFRCRKCTKLFETKTLLKNHMLEHEKEKNFVCDTCGRVFTRQDYLYKHKLMHAGIKQHQCPHCDFRATQRSTLTVHIRKHTGERPYSCDMCPQRCISSSNLRAHRRRHLGLKKYECTICSKKFGYKISLEEHVTSTHVRSETHSCEHCGATYSRVRALRRHLAAKHGKPPKEKETSFVVAVTENPDKMEVVKTVEYELKDGDNVLLLKHQDGDVYMV